MTWETDEATARARLERAVAWDQAPALTAAEVDDLMVIARRPDINGYSPLDTGWTPTWDIRAATTEGWRWKMAKAVSHTGFSADGATFNREQLIAHCEKMIAAGSGGGKRLGMLAWTTAGATRDPLDAPVIGNL